MASADCALLGIKPSDFGFHFIVVLRFKHQHSSQGMDKIDPITQNALVRRDLRTPSLD
jgi:hypothetical protein